MLYDPELVGFFLGRIVPPSPTGDFQDLAMWRTMVAEFAIALTRHYDATIIVPMTVVRFDYFQEITKPIVEAGVDMRSFALHVTAPTLRQRITAQVMNPDDPVDDERIRQWRLDQVDRCVAALVDEPLLGEPVSNDGRAVSEVVAQIADAIQS